MERVSVYVDGFNLFYGLRDTFGRRCHWLDLEALAVSLLKPGQTLEAVTYFTAAVLNDLPAEHRQATYLSALTAHCPRLRIVIGRFQRKTVVCFGCRSSWVSYEEKESDVAFATELVADAATGRYDTALLVTGDSDMSPAVRAVRRLAPQARVIAAFPPGRRSAVLAKVTQGCLDIRPSTVRRNQLPATVTTADGVVLRRPAHWH